MSKKNTVIVVGKENHLSAYYRADGAEFKIGEYHFPLPKQLAPLCAWHHEGRPLLTQKHKVSEFTHTDGCVYLVGIEDGDNRGHDFAAIIDFINGHHEHDYRWM